MKKGNIDPKMHLSESPHAAVIFPQQCFYLMTFGGHNVDIIKREWCSCNETI